jgi:hypothetical protein
MNAAAHFPDVPTLGRNTRVPICIFDSPIKDGAYPTDAPVFELDDNLVTWRYLQEALACVQPCTFMLLGAQTIGVGRPANCDYLFSELCLPKTWVLIFHAVDFPIGHSILLEFLVQYVAKLADFSGLYPRRS